MGCGWVADIFGGTNNLFVATSIIKFNPTINKQITHPLPLPTHNLTPPTNNPSAATSVTNDYHRNNNPVNRKETSR